jgi:hypothetical protein
MDHVAGILSRLAGQAGLLPMTGSLLFINKNFPLLDNPFLKVMLLVQWISDFLFSLPGSLTTDNDS